MSLKYLFLFYRCSNGLCICAPIQHTDSIRATYLCCSVLPFRCSLFWTKCIAKGLRKSSFL